ncbi:MAG TPA: biotin carboxylase N-terminal domain-containing protein [Streptosporangiaceae bacterium]|nr:biotin carboxylase N-terminal domain-containing protein [Streptosporangiaceae bacterium]
MINSVLVANRGEIARRIFRTCADLGLATVAVFSDADADGRLPHVGEADAAVRLPGAAPAETYLRGDLLVAAARAAGADAVHPGYGFLSENADFARAVIEAGLTWIGPPPDAIAAMGSKIEAKKLVADVGVPVLPELDPETVAESDLPLLVKASAGGGGRGMRVVRTLEELPGALAAARREARSAFGDPAVFCEPLIEGGRHVEVQVLADRHGTVWTLGERECSIQRRHQKIIEEAPSPAVSPDLRARLCEAAAAAARTIGYEGAGTVEFLLRGDGRFFFLEVNTRLQVEHPVTECVYGVDLVRLQIEIAEDARLPARPPEPRGHAIEVRLYAEDPAREWRPATGRLHTFEVPGVDAEFRVPASYGLRLDSGVTAGGEIGVHYDPMLAKVIAWAPTRAAAARRLAAALRRSRLHGVTTNRDLLVRVLTEEGFRAGDIATDYLERRRLAEPLADAAAVRLSALAAALADAAANRAAAPVLGGLPSGWRNVPSQRQRKAYAGPFGEIEVTYRLTRDGLRADDHPGVRHIETRPDSGTATHHDHQVTLELGGVRRTFVVRTARPASDSDLAGSDVFVDSELGPVTLRALPRFADPLDLVVPGSLLAPMPGTVVRILAERGATVIAGQPLVVIEAMKMEHPIAAATSGTLTELNVAPGQQVDSGATLAVIVPPS